VSFDEELQIHKKLELQRAHIEKMKSENTELFELITFGIYLAHKKRQEGQFLEEPSAITGAQMTEFMNTVLKNKTVILKFASFFAVQLFSVFLFVSSEYLIFNSSVLIDNEPPPESFFSIKNIKTVLALLTCSILTAGLKNYLIRKINMKLIQDLNVQIIDTIFESDIKSILNKKFHTILDNVGRDLTKTELLIPELVRELFEKVSDLIVNGIVLVLTYSGLPLITTVGIPFLGWLLMKKVLPTYLKISNLSSQIDCKMDDLNFQLLSIIGRYRIGGHIKKMERKLYNYCDHSSKISLVKDQGYKTSLLLVLIVIGTTILSLNSIIFEFCYREKTNWFNIKKPALVWANICNLRFVQSLIILPQLIFELVEIRFNFYRIWSFIKNQQVSNKQIKTTDTRGLAKLDFDSPVGFRKVSLTRGLQPILKRISFSIQANSRVGLFGVDGGGRTSIFELLTSIYQRDCLEKSSISLFGRKIESLDENVIKSLVFLIERSPVLFEGTVRKNLDPYGEKKIEELISILRELHVGIELLSLDRESERASRRDNDSKILIENKISLYEKLSDREILILNACAGKEKKKIKNKFNANSESHHEINNEKSENHRINASQPNNSVPERKRRFTILSYLDKNKPQHSDSERGFESIVNQRKSSFHAANERKTLIVKSPRSNKLRSINQKRTSINHVVVEKPEDAFQSESNRPIFGEEVLNPENDMNQPNLNHEPQSEFREIQDANQFGSETSVKTVKIALRENPKINAKGSSTLPAHGEYRIISKQRTHTANEFVPSTQAIKLELNNLPRDNDEESLPEEELHQNSTPVKPTNLKKQTFNEPFVEVFQEPDPHANDTFEPLKYSSKRASMKLAFSPYSEQQRLNSEEEAEQRKTFEEMAQRIADGYIIKFLASKVSFEGKNLSTATRKMLMVCRAVLAQPKILLIYEETLEFGKGIQSNLEILDKKMPNTTIVCVIKENQNLLQYQRLIFLDAGKLVEKGSPYELFRNRQSFIYKYLKETDRDNLEFILERLAQTQKSNINNTVDSDINKQVFSGRESKDSNNPSINKEVQSQEVAPKIFKSRYSTQALLHLHKLETEDFEPPRKRSLDEAVLRIDLNIDEFEHDERRSHQMHIPLFKAKAFFGKQPARLSKIESPENTDKRQTQRPKSSDNLRIAAKPRITTHLADLLEEIPEESEVSDFMRLRSNIKRFPTSESAVVRSPPNSFDGRK